MTGACVIAASGKSAARRLAARNAAGGFGGDDALVCAGLRWSLNQPAYLITGSPTRASILTSPTEHGRTHSGGETAIVARLNRRQPPQPLPSL